MRGDRHHIADVEEFDGDGSKIIAEVSGQEIAVFRLAGEFYAVANYCPHQAAPLCEGVLTGKVGVADDGWELTYDDEVYIECPWHSWQFDVRTGENAADDRYRVPTYEVEVSDGGVYVLR